MRRKIELVIFSTKSWKRKICQIDKTQHRQFLLSGPVIGGILNSASLTIPDALPAIQFLRSKFSSSLDIKFAEEMEGMEKKIVFNL